VTSTFRDVIPEPFFACPASQKHFAEYDAEQPSNVAEYRQVRFGKPIVFYIPFNGTGSAQYPRRHDLSHQHSSRIKNLKIDKEEQRAVNRA
jgi:hypothetical protein